MTVEGVVSRADLIRYALKQMDMVELEGERILKAMTNVQTSAQAQELYADTRENAGRQRALRHMLGYFEANTVIPSVASINDNEAESIDMSKVKRGMQTTISREDLNEAKAKFAETGTWDVGAGKIQPMPEVGNFDVINVKVLNVESINAEYSNAKSASAGNFVTESYRPISYGAGGGGGYPSGGGGGGGSVNAQGFGSGGGGGNPNR
jgi:uncharacterized membrane protein YgcG